MAGVGGCDACDTCHAAHVHVHACAPAHTCYTCSYAHMHAHLNVCTYIFQYMFLCIHTHRCVTLKPLKHSCSRTKHCHHRLLKVWHILVQIIKSCHGGDVAGVNDYFVYNSTLDEVSLQKGRREWEQQQVLCVCASVCSVSLPTNTSKRTEKRNETHPLPWTRR